MAHTLGSTVARATSAGNPITTAGVVIVDTDTVVGLLIKTVGATDRAGAAPSMNGVSFTQASIAQKAAASPEAGCELWYLLNPCKRFMAGTYAVTIPNTGAATLFYTFITGRAAAGGTSALDVAGGSNGTSIDPNPGALTTTADGDFGLSVCASGATDFDPATPAGTGFETGTGTPLGTFDDGAHGGGQQYHLQATKGAFTLGWTFGTSDDWGCVAAYFKEIPPHAFNNYMRIKVASTGWVGNG